MREPNPHRGIGLILRLGVMLALTPGWLGGLALPSRFQPAIPAAGASFERADDDITVDILPTWWAEPSAAWSTSEGGAVASADPTADQENGRLQDGGIIYVDAGASGSNTGASWVDAFTDIQSALAAALSGDEIWVAAGTYTSTSTFQLVNSVALYGGFSGVEADREQRDWEKNVTILSGDTGTPGFKGDNRCHIVTASGTDASALLDGFTITGAYCGGIGMDGGGMYNVGGSPTLANITFSDNDADCGGGMYNEGNSPMLTNITFKNNTARTAGGGLFTEAGNPILTNAIFSGNRAMNNGGGMSNFWDGSPILINVVFSNNSAGVGGGMYNGSSDNLMLTNTTFSSNTASVQGGGLYCDRASSVEVTNSIFWANTVSSGEISSTSGHPTITYSLVQGGYPGTGNISADPQFLRAPIPMGWSVGADGDLRLGTGSPALDAGDSSALPPDTADLDGDGNTSEPIPFDLAGNPRFTGRAVDMGAYEYVPHGSRDTALPVVPGVHLTEIITATDEAAWYKIDVPEPGSTLTVTLSGLCEDHDLYLFGPAIDEATGQLRDLPMIQESDMIQESPMVQESGVSGNPADLLDLWQDARGERNICRTENIGLMGNTGQLGGIGSLLCISARDGIDSEMVALNVHELYGPFYVAVSGHTPEAANQPYTLTAHIKSPAGEPCLPLTHTVAVTFTNLVIDTTFPSKTLIIFNRTRFNDVFTATDTITSSQLVTRLDRLKDQVNGKIINLDEYPEINKAYEIRERYPTCPQAANFVATQIKFLLYNLVPAYPNLEYLVIVGGDPIIPYRRIRDEAVFANERRYATWAHAPTISQSLASRYFLSDDYYTTMGSASLPQGQELLLPIPWKGRELYLPHMAIGRLVEVPSEIVAAIDAFLEHPVITPTDGLVTGYDFLTDQAQVISQTLSNQGITTTLDTLINDTWTADDLRSRLITATDTFTAARDLNSLNAHFCHFALAPADPSTYVHAAEIAQAPVDYRGTLAFSVGCHSGLNVPDADCDSNEAATDWAQAFLRRGASFIGNTGYGYGDADQVAYSERLMVNFVEELNYVVDGPQRVNRLPTVGGALLRAKHRYYNSAAAGAFSNYDEKVMGQTTLYGLPMLAVRMPVWTDTLPGGAAAEDTVTLTLNYSVTSAAAGTYHTILNQAGADVQALGARPIEPRLSLDIHRFDTIAHGVLMLGGAFADVTDFDPVISLVVSDSISSASAGEPTYPENHWYPAQIATINRFLGSDGQSRDRLVVLPGQFRATVATTPTRGTQRLYSNLALQVYRAPLTDTDFIAPSIWQVRAISYPLSLSDPFPLRFRVQVEDDSGSIERTVVLYRQEGENEWSRVELAYNPATGWATGSAPPVDRDIHYFAQAVDPSGNVALALDHGNPFERVERATRVYLPLAFRDYLPAPDLVVGRITPVGNNVQVVVRNQGNAPATDDFWVDLYVDPDPVPTAVNQIWEDLADEGVVWDVTADIRPNEALTLTIGDAYTSREYTGFSGSLEAGTWIYVQADSANALTDYGGVLEDHEITGDPYNNIAGVRLSAPVDVGPLASDRPSSPAGRLPPRP